MTFGFLSRLLNTAPSLPHDLFTTNHPLCFQEAPGGPQYLGQLPSAHVVATERCGSVQAPGYSQMREVFAEDANQCLRIMAAISEVMQTVASQDPTKMRVFDHPDEAATATRRCRNTHPNADSRAKEQPSGKIRDSDDFKRSEIFFDGDDQYRYRLRQHWLTHEGKPGDHYCGALSFGGNVFEAGGGTVKYLPRTLRHDVFISEGSQRHCPELLAFIKYSGESKVEESPPTQRYKASSWTAYNTLFEGHMRSFPVMCTHNPERCTD